MKRAKPSKKIIAIITVVLAVILFGGWFFCAFIQLNSVEAGNYNADTGTKFIAHRGYSAKYFENTYEAFEAACKDSYFQGVETDVWRTKDGVYVCCHNENPFADKFVKVTEKTYDEIKDLPLDLTTAKPKTDVTLQYRICTLSDYLYLCNRYHKTAVVEIKQSLNKEETTALCDFLLDKINYRYLQICSFDREVVRYAFDYKNYFDVKVFSSKKTKANFNSVLGYNVSLSYKSVTKSFVEKCHKRGAYVDVYTVDDTEEIKKLVEYGVDYITTNGQEPIA